ncbi:uncharacterized protein V6R79_016862 [Siganus canaliculatus]
MTIVVLLLVLLTVGEALSSTRVVGHKGDNVTLNCKYDVKPSGVLHICWNRGAVPHSKCNNQLISTDGHKVITRLSSRYQLLGRLDKGDVSLTILNVRESDAGKYGCRVEKPGLFNDEKHHFDLVIEAPQTTPWTRSGTETWTEPPSTEPTPTNQTSGQLTSAETTLTSSFDTVKAEGNDVVTVVLVLVLFGLIAGVTVAALVVIARRWKQLNKIPQQTNAERPVQFSSTSSSLHLHSRSSAVENIYQIDGGVDEGEYEYCP